MRRIVFALMFMGLWLCGAGYASAQGVTRICITTNSLGGCQDIGANFPLPVSISGSGGGGSPSTPSYVSPGTGVCTDTPVTLAAATSTQLLAAAAGRKTVMLQDIGANPVTWVDGSGAAVVGNGPQICGTTGTCPPAYNFPVPPTNAIQGISTAGSTVIVETCQ